VQLDGFDQRRHLPREHGGHPRQPRRHLLWLDASESTAPATCIIIEGNAVTTNQQIKTDLSSETQPPTPRDLIARINRVEGMLSDTIKVYERVKHPRTTSSLSSMHLGLRNAARVASCYMKRKIQIESGPRTQDSGSCRSHLDEPCPFHEKSKHTACQCRVLKKFRQPLTAAHRRQLNQESSPDRLAFQVAHTTISPNYPGEESETQDHQILVVSADVPPQDGETDEQRQESENANAARAIQRQQELATAAPGVGHQRLTPDKSTPTPGNKHLRHQLLRSSDAMMIHLVPTDCVHETYSGTSSTMDSKSTTRRKPTWVLLLPL
jgi:hypothetical protein